MPFIGLLESLPVVPTDVGDKERVVCPDCGDEMGVRDGDVNIRHFWHFNGRSEGCGESDEHKRMKAIAASKAHDEWPESEIAVSLEEAVDNRRADVLVEFPDGHSRFGEALAIEVQYKNKGKNRSAWESDVHSRNVSVLWLEKDQFNDNDVNLWQGELSAWWSKQIPTVDSWTGHHGIVKWLRQEKPTSVQISIQPHIYTDTVWFNSLLPYWANGRVSLADDSGLWKKIISQRVHGGAKLTLLSDGDGYLHIELKNESQCRIPLEPITAEKIKEFALSLPSILDKEVDYTPPSDVGWYWDKQIPFGQSGSIGIKRTNEGEPLVTLNKGSQEEMAALFDRRVSEILDFLINVSQIMEQGN